MGAFAKAIRGFGGGRSAGSGGPVEAVWNGAVIARSDATVVVEGNHYFPPGSVEWDRLVASDRRSVCPWKGQASYYSVEVDGERAADAVWSYPTPKPAAEEIADHVAFDRKVEIRPAQAA